MYSKIQKKTQKEADKAHKERLDRCIPVAREIIKLIAKHADVIPMGEVERDDEGYTPVMIEILTLLLERNIHWTDRDFVFQLANQAYSFPGEVVKENLNHSYTVATGNLWGHPISELTLQDIDKHLQKQK